MGIYRTAAVLMSAAPHRRPVPLNQMPVTTATPGSALEAAQDELARQLDEFAGRACARCRENPPGPGGILCGPCKAEIESRSADDWYPETGETT